MATQNLMSLTLSDSTWSMIDSALAELELHLTTLISLDGDRRRVARMGDKSEAFCRQAVSMLEQNPQLVPPSLDVPGARADLDAIDRLRPRLGRLRRLTERAQDSEAALGSDVMACALQGYALLKVAGKNQGLEGLRRDLGSRFNKSPRAVAEPISREREATASP